jgi:hypothetical protein
MARIKAKASARRTSPRTAAKRPAARKTGSSARMRRRAARPSQRFVVSHHREEDFEGGLRAYAKYRDLGVAQATNGLVRAHVIRFIPPCRPEEVSKRHYHDVEFQMIYVLKGWINPVNQYFFAVLFNMLHDDWRKWMAAVATSSQRYFQDQTPTTVRHLVEKCQGHAAYEK